MEVHHTVISERMQTVRGTAHVLDIPKTSPKAKVFIASHFSIPVPMQPDVAAWGSTTTY